MQLTVVNENKDGTLDGVHATATVTGAIGTVTFNAGKLHPTHQAGSSVPATPLGEGCYELNIGDQWLWWITATDDVGSAHYPVWVGLTDLVLDEEIAQAIHGIVLTNKAAIDVRMRAIDPEAEVQTVIYGMREEVDVVPSIEVIKNSTRSEWNTMPFGRKFVPESFIICYSHRSDDPVSDQSLLGQMAAAVRDLLFRYVDWKTASGLSVTNLVVADIEYNETLSADNKVVGMATLPVSCYVELSVPAGYPA